jgi:hypothetical protein
VKVRGHRIDLDEIRSVLHELADVSAAAVVVNGQHDGPAQARIDAYVVLKAGSAALDIRARLRQTLPEYMVPNTITVVPSLPMTVNGKVDAKRLPAPARHPTTLEAEPVDTPDDGDIAGLMLRVWREFFGPHVRAGDNFFELGGNSLLAARLITRLRGAGLSQLSLRTIYEHSTPEELARAANGGAGRVL